jgi:aspartyl-tRNA(Asn)/glutamyl-tRNA(Gln) amidotransferase subunit C
MLSEEKIKKEGLALLDEFSRELEKVPESEETHYVVDLKNIVRADGLGVVKEGFPAKFQKLVPKWEDGFVSVEKGV